MASRAIEAGRAFMRLGVDDSEFSKKLRGAQSRLKSFGANIATIGAGFAGFGSTLAAPLTAAIKAASDAQETYSKFNVVFGENADAARAWGDELAGQVGRSKREVAGFLAGFQDLLVPIGIDPDRAEESSKQLTQLAIDLASFNNLADGDAVRDLQAALTGSSEVMKKYGVIVNQAAVNTELLNQGIDPKVATEQEKVFARLNIIMAGTTAAQGDAARTADGFANRMKALRGRVSDAAVAVGQALLPAVTAVVGRVVKGVEAFGQWAEANGDTIRQVGILAAALTGIGAAFLTFGASVSGIGFAITGVTTAVGGLSAALTFLAANPVVAVALVPIALAARELVSEFVAAQAAAAKLDDTLRQMEARQTFGDSDELRTLVQRFEQLAGKASLTSDELAEAESALKSLRSEYGITAGQIDTANGRIEDSERALAQLRAAQSQQSRKQLAARIFAQQRIIQLLRREQSEALGTGGNGRDRRRAEERAAGFEKRIVEAQEELAKLREQRARVLRLVQDTDAPAAIELASDAKAAGESAGESYAEAFTRIVNGGIGDGVDFVGDAILKAQDAVGEFLNARREELVKLVKDGGIRRSVDGAEFNLREGAFGGRNLAAQAAVSNIEKDTLAELRKQSELLQRLEEGGGRLVFTT